MCGIVAAVSSRNIVPILVQGLQRLEYRGYDSCGVAVYADGLKRARSTSRVAELQEQVSAEHIAGRHRHRPHPLGHPRRAGRAQRPPAFQPRHRRRQRGAAGQVALVHNGIIENHDELRAALQAKGYVFESQTDTEVIAHLIDSLYDGDLFEALKAAVAQLHGAYAIAVFCKDEPHRVVGARAGSPLILGVGDGDNERNLPGQRRDGAGRRDRPDRLPGRRRHGRPAAGQVLDGRPPPASAPQREVKTVQAHSGAAELGPYRHYMQKEIFEQPRAIADTLEGVERHRARAVRRRGLRAPSRTSTRC